MAENEYKEIPVEVINRIKSKAYQAWGESEIFNILKAIEGFDKARLERIKVDFLKRHEDAEQKLYLQIERDKKGQVELSAAYEEKLAEKEKNYQEVMRENARLLTRLQNVHAPKQ